MASEYFRIPAEIVRSTIARLDPDGAAGTSFPEHLASLTNTQLAEMLRQLVAAQDGAAGAEVPLKMRYPLSEEEQQQKDDLLSQMRMQMQVTRLTLKPSASAPLSAGKTPAGAAF